MWKTNYAKKYFADKVVCEAKRLGKQHHMMNMCKCVSLITFFRASFLEIYIELKPQEKFLYLKKFTNFKEYLMIVR